MEISRGAVTPATSLYAVTCSPFLGSVPASRSPYIYAPNQTTHIAKSPRHLAHRQKQRYDALRPNVITDCHFRWH
jgi:hypothetical protein